MVIFTVNAETFPAQLTCDTGEEISIKITGNEQRLTYTSSHYGTFNGYLEVFKGQSTKNQYEAIANIHGLSRYNSSLLSFTLLMKRINGEIDNNSIIYQYLYTQNGRTVKEGGQCIPVKNGEFIEGSKSY
ncbi:TPA: hypothetical protein ACQJLA_001416 [Raoultella ornithinolytica]